MGPVDAAKQDFILESMLNAQDRLDQINIAKLNAATDQN